MTALLSLQSVSKRFGAVVVADNVDLSLDEGEALGILGPNGAGKTSLFNIIAGVHAPDAGRVFFRGEDITHLGASRRCQIGIGRSFQIPQPFGGLSVFENLCVTGFFGARRDRAGVESRAVEVLQLTGMLAKANALASSLTLLERKRLELARALAGDPQLLLLDEIAGGLTPHECEDLIVAINQIRQTGVSVIWIEHVVHALLAVVDGLFVLHQGAKLIEGDPRAVMDSPEVHEIYLGLEANA